MTVRMTVFSTARSIAAMLAGCSLAACTMSTEVAPTETARSNITISNGFYIRSDANQGLVMMAFLSNGFDVKIGTCGQYGCWENTLWRYENGMIVAAANPAFAVNAAGGAQHLTTLKVTTACTASNPDCTWTLKNGLFFSDTDPSLAINAFGGAQQGTVLRLHNGCNASNPDCTWTLSNLMIDALSDTLAWDMSIGLLRLSNSCAPSGHCLYSVSHGLIWVSPYPSLFLRAGAGAPAHESVLSMFGNCTSSDPACTWTFRRGAIRNDSNTSLWINSYGGAANGTILRLHNGCATTNPDCVYNLR